jgi:hypothetical protein
MENDIGEVCITLRKRINCYITWTEDSIWEAYCTSKDNIKIMLERYRLCGLVVRVSGYRSRGLGFDSRPSQTSWEVGSLERGPFSLVSRIEELLEWKSSGSGPENWD